MSMMTVNPRLQTSSLMGRGWGGSLILARVVCVTPTVNQAKQESRLITRKQPSSRALTFTGGQ